MREFREINYATDNTAPQRPRPLQTHRILSYHPIENIRDYINHTYQRAWDNTPMSMDPWRRAALANTAVLHSLLNDRTRLYQYIDWRYSPEYRPPSALFTRDVHVTPVRIQRFSLTMSNADLLNTDFYNSDTFDPRDANNVITYEIMEENPEIKQKHYTFTNLDRSRLSHIDIQSIQSMNIDANTQFHFRQFAEANNLFIAYDLYDPTVSYNDVINNVGPFYFSVRALQGLNIHSAIEDLNAQFNNIIFNYMRQLTLAQHAQDYVGPVLPQ